jgi:hypothetical protein
LVSWWGDVLQKIRSGGAGTINPEAIVQTAAMNIDFRSIVGAVFNRSRSSFSFSFSRCGENENDYENENEPDLGSFGCGCRGAKYPG